MFIRQIHLFIIIILIINFTSSNTSYSQDDITKYEYALSLYNKEKYIDSINEFTNLIKLGSLNEEKLSSVFLYRGIAFYKNDNNVNAITDITSSLWFNNLSNENKKLAHQIRALARDKIGHNDLANQDKLYVSNAKKDNDFQFNIENKNESIISLSDIEVSKKINFMNNNFSKNFSNFFGRKKPVEANAIELIDSQESVNEGIINRPGLLEDIVNGPVTIDTSIIEIAVTPDLYSEINEPLTKNVIEINHSDIVEEINDNKKNNDSINESISNIVSFFKNKTVVNSEEQVIINNTTKSPYYSYIELGKFNSDYDAKVGLNKIMIKHYIALSGLTPYIVEDIVDDIQMIYTIKLGPFSSKDRVKFICDKFISTSDYCIKIER